MNDSKRLKPSTIIPDSLYVERDADEQLQRSIKARGRPPYVLVARQMGKTNLLLHAKQKMETPSDIFLYLDLSVRFSTLSETFRHIIDVALDAKPFAFNARKEIMSIREQGRDPQREYETSLRLISAATPGNVVIIMDEIDSLTALKFSDQIFAQIRSLYFSRATYHELEKVTYVLSGVAEPTDLIRDKKISPFNIGEKIYLSDFTAEQSALLTEKADLKFSPEVINRVYHWVSGNPRMTWDVYSELEDRLYFGSRVESSDVDDVINKLYLREFDRAPIDHIRTLAEADISLRSSVIKIRKHEFAEISAGIRAKLYLSGIVNVGFEEENLSIKNRVIEAALSDKWLLDLSKRTLELRSAGISHIVARRFSTAIEVFTEYLQDTSISESEADFARYQLGFALWSNNQFVDATPYLEEVLSYNENTNHSRHARLLLALCYYRQGRRTESVPHLNIIVTASSLEDGIWIKAASALVGIYVEIDAFKNKDLIESLAARVFLSLERHNSVSLDEYDQIVAALNLNLAIAYETWEDKERAIYHLENAQRYAQPALLIRVILRLLSLVEKSQRYGLTEHLGAALRNLQKSPNSAIESSPYAQSEDTIFDALLVLLDLNEQEFNASKEHVRLFALNTELSPIAMQIRLFEHSFFQDAAEPRLALLEAISLLALDKEPKILALEALRNLVVFTNASSEQITRYADLFCELYGTQQVSTSPSDLMATFKATQVFLRNGNIRKAHALLDAMIRSRKDYQYSQRDFVLVDFAELNLYQSSGRHGEAVQIARRLILNYDAVSDERSSMLPRPVLDDIRKAAEKFANTFESTFLQKQKFGRNDFVKVRYNNGLVLHRKYKHLQKDIESGVCVIVDD